MTMEIAKVLDLEVVHDKVLDVVQFPFKLNGGEGHRLAFQLNFEGIDAIGVQVSVAQSVDELSGFEAWKQFNKKVFESAIVVIIVKIRRKIVLVVLVHQMLLVLKSKNCHNSIILKRNSIHKT